MDVPESAAGGAPSTAVHASSCRASATRPAQALIALLALFLVSPAWAQVATPVNSQGTAGAPISVTNGVSKVLAGNNTRQHWAVFSETVAIRCTLGTSGDVAGSPVPSTTVGFFFNFGVVYNETAFQGGSATATRRLDCYSTGAATNVDTWEE